MSGDGVAADATGNLFFANQRAALLLENGHVILACYPFLQPRRTGGNSIR
jgi:hypothetical protein